MMTQESRFDYKNQADLLRSKTMQHKQETCPQNNRTLVARDPQPVQ